MKKKLAFVIATWFGLGFSPIAPGTVGTLWGWAAFAILNLWLTPVLWGVVIAASIPIGWWASTVTARHLRTCDTGSVVWDEIVAIWLVLWLLMPAGFWWQLAAFGVFRFFDAAKPGPVRWADALFKIEPGQPVTVWQGFGILFDDLVAAACTLVVLAGAKALLH